MMMHFPFNLPHLEKLLLEELRVGGELVVLGDERQPQRSSLVQTKREIDENNI